MLQTIDRHQRKFLIEKVGTGARVEMRKMTGDRVFIGTADIDLRTAIPRWQIHRPGKQGKTLNDSTVDSAAIALIDWYMADIKPITQESRNGN
jgi:hypothetical protein